MTIDSRSFKLAVLIDAENTSSKIADALFEEIEQAGEAIIRRVYGDFSSPQMKSWAQPLVRHGLVAHQQFATATGKNASDIALVIDAMDLLYSGGVSGFCLVSSDSDFTPLALRLRESGMAVFGFGKQASSESYRRACSRFIPTDSFAKVTEAPAQPAVPPKAVAAPPALPAPKNPSPKPPATTDPNAAKPKQPPSAATPILKRAMGKAVSVNGWVALTSLGSELNGLKPSDYGSAKLRTLVERTGAFEMEPSSNGQVRIRLREGPAG